MGETVGSGKWKQNDNTDEPAHHDCTSRALELFLRAANSRHSRGMRPILRVLVLSVSVVALTASCDKSGDKTGDKTADKTGDKATDKNW